MPCHMHEGIQKREVKEPVCQSFIDKELSCGHTVNVKCSSSIEGLDKKCEILTSYELSCKHKTAEVPCNKIAKMKGDPTLEPGCDTEVDFALPCGHSAKLSCSMMKISMEFGPVPNCKVEEVTRTLLCGH